MPGVRTGISCQSNRKPTRSCRFSVAAATRTASCNSYQVSSKAHTLLPLRTTPSAGSRRYVEAAPSPLGTYCGETPILEVKGYRRAAYAATTRRPARWRASCSLARAESSIEGGGQASAPAVSDPDPLPPVDIVVDARRLETIGRIEGQIRHVPVSENDRVTKRYCEEGDTHLALAERDKSLVGQAETPRNLIESTRPEALLAILSQANEGVTAISETLVQRRPMTP